MATGIRIYRGTNQIGGIVTEIRKDEKIFFSLNRGCTMGLLTLILKCI